MTEPEHKKPNSLVRVVGCLGVFAIIVGLVALCVIVSQHQARLSFERSKQEWRQNAIDSVKQGSSSALVIDSKLLPMLANDAVCRKNVTRLDFASTEIDAVDSPFVAALPNVTSMSFYCTRGTKGLLTAARTLPISTLHFEMPDLSIESYLTLKEFPHLKAVRFEHVMDDEWINRLKSEMPNVAIDAPFPRSQEPGFAK